MKQRLFFKICFINSFFITYSTCYASLNMRGNTSFIRVTSGATFAIDQAISAMNGKLIKDSGATISGSDITFSDGLMKDIDNDLLLTAVFQPATSDMSLVGSQTLRANPGQVLQSLQVSGAGNRLEGQPSFASNITLANGSATLIVAVQRAINQNIVLNSGTIQLDDDLKFADGKTFSGNGTIDLNGYRLILGGTNLTMANTITWNNSLSASDITLNSALTLNGAFTFNQTTRINGNGNILDLSGGGSLTVANDKILYLSDVHLKGLGTGGGSITLNNAGSQLRLSNVTIELAGNATTAQGGVYVDGPTTVVVKNSTWAFNTSGSLTVDGVTLWKDHVGISTASRGNITGAITLSNNGDIEYTRELIDYCDALATSTGELQSSITSNDSDISTLQSNVTSNDSDIVNLQSQITSNDTDISSLQSQVTSNDSDISTLQSNVSSNDSDISTLQSNVSTLQTNVTSNDTDISTLQSNVTSNDSDITNLQTLSSALQTSTGELQSAITNNDTDISSLQSQVTSNDTDISTL